MARIGRRKTEEEMAEIMRRQGERGQTNEECAVEAGLRVETIKSSAADPVEVAVGEGRRAGRVGANTKPDSGGVGGRAS